MWNELLNVSVAPVNNASVNATAFEVVSSTLANSVVISSVVNWLTTVAYSSSSLSVSTENKIAEPS